MVIKSQDSRRSRGNPPRRCEIRPNAGGAARLDGSLVLRREVRDELSQTGELNGPSSLSSFPGRWSSRSNGVRHVARVTGEAG
jgi:hypothetical protein